MLVHSDPCSRTEYIPVQVIWEWLTYDIDKDQEQNTIQYRLLEND